MQRRVCVKPLQYSRLFFEYFTVNYEKQGVKYKSCSSNSNVKIV